MSILTELNNRGIKVRKTEQFFRGYCTTEKGVEIITSRSFSSKCEESIYFLDNGKGKNFPCNDQVLFIASGTEYEGKIKSIEEANKLASEGKIYSFKSSDLYAEYYNFDSNEDLECCFRYGYSPKSKKYIEGVMRDIGLINYTDASNGSGSLDGEPTKFEIIREADVFVNAETKIGKLKEDKWIAQTCFQFEIDDFAVIKMYFDHNPTDSDLKAAFTIREFEHKPIEIFKCYECGRLMNWLETEGDIKRKYDMAVEHYCGC